MLIHSPKELALLVISQRKNLKLSQAEVGNRVGLKQQTISEFEIKPERTQVDTLFRILSALSLDIRILAKAGEVGAKTQWKEEW